jgi:hypothetical protein
MISLLYITARGLFPMSGNSLSTYDLLAHCLQSQVDAVGHPFTDYEVIIVDAQNTLPRREIEHAARHSVGGVRFLRPRATPWVRMGAFAPNSARNTGLAWARGVTVVGLDDCWEIGPRYLSRVAELAANGIYTTATLRMVDDSVAYAPQPIGDVPADQYCGGLTSYPLTIAVAINGWDERFDGSSGGDCDFFDRCRRSGVRFVRDGEVMALGHPHGVRQLAHPRCEKLVCDVGLNRRGDGLLRANEPWTHAELDAFEHCGRNENDCALTGFTCDYTEPEGMRERAIRLEYESQSWFNLAEARTANGLE